MSNIFFKEKKNYTNQLFYELLIAMLSFFVEITLLTLNINIRFGERLTNDNFQLFIFQSY